MSRSSTPPIRVLLVDDEVSFTDVIAKRLRKRNIDVTTAYSGSEGIRAMRGSTYDVTVLDLKMEDMDGIDVLKILKTLDPEMPVLMLTGHGSEESAREGLNQGASDYLTKPYEFEQLITKITEVSRKNQP